MGVNKLEIPYPDFQLNTTIEPEEFDLNNSFIVNKVNDLISEINVILDGATTGSGASKVNVKPFANFTSTNLQMLLQELVGYLSTTNGSKLIGKVNTSGASGNTLHDQVLSIVSRIDGLKFDVDGLIPTLSIQIAKLATNISFDYSKPVAVSANGIPYMFFVTDDGILGLEEKDVKKTYNTSYIKSPNGSAFQVYSENDGTLVLFKLF